MMSPGSEGSSLDSLGQLNHSTASEAVTTDTGMATTTSGMEAAGGLVGGATSLQALYPGMAGMMYTADGQYLVPSEYYAQPQQHPDVAAYFLPPPLPAAQVAEPGPHTLAMIGSQAGPSAVQYHYPAGTVMAAGELGLPPTSALTPYHAPTLLASSSGAHIPASAEQDMEGGISYSHHPTQGPGTPVPTPGQHAQDTHTHSGAPTPPNVGDSSTAVPSPVTVPISPAERLPQESPVPTVATSSPQAAGCMDISTDAQLEAGAEGAQPSTEATRAMC